MSGTIRRHQLASDLFTSLSLIEEHYLKQPFRTYNPLYAKPTSWSTSGGVKTLQEFYKYRRCQASKAEGGAPTRDNLQYNVM